MRLSLRTKLAGAFGAVILMGILSSGITVYQLTEISRIQKDIKTIRVPLALSAERTSRNISDAGFQFRNYIIYGEDPQLAAKYDGLREAAWKRLFDELGKMKTLAGEQDQKTLAQLEDHARNGSLQIQIDTLPNLIGRGAAARERALERMKAGAGLAAKVQADCAELNKSAQDALAKDNDRLSSLQNTAWITGVVSLLATIAIVTAVGLLLSRKLTHAVRVLNDRMRMIAAGDLRGEALVDDSGDEIGMIFGILNTMQKNLKETISSVAQGAERVASASEQISASATQIAQSSETQKEHTAQVATAMQEMASTVAEVSDASSRASDNARSADDLAQTGGQIVSDTVEMIRSVAEATRDTAKKIEALGSSSNQIGVIIAVIDEIADQTNLLALNAAIEAARAGEQGRGFAVVADEVRKLAERTTSATKEVAAMVETIQQETKKAVEAMRTGTNQVDAGVDAANKASEALKKIIDSAAGMQDMVSHISIAAVQQTAAAREVNQSMDEIAKMVHQSSLSARESAKGCQNLSTLGFELHDVVSRFKTGTEKEIYRPAHRTTMREGAKVQ
jgi:methyl-accepting chemotaxis protein